MKVFIDYDKEHDVFIATSADNETLKVSSASDLFVRMYFVRAAKVAGLSGHANDYDFVLRSTRLSQEGDKPVDLDEFWDGTNKARIKRNKEILDMAKKGVDVTVIAAKFDWPVKYIERIIDGQS